jgi:hypothetical protein
MESIEDNEILYRPVPNPDLRDPDNPLTHYAIQEGVFRVKRSAFNDKAYQPSVDRKKLISVVSEIKFRETDVVVQLLAQDVRNISIFQSEGRTHDVHFDPQKDRPAHSLIVTKPPFVNKDAKKKWKQFQELLAIAASKYVLIGV